jgi:hypothetical protein
MAEEHKLQVDDDWKNQAAAEKERLSKKIDEEQRQPWPEADLTGLVQLLAMQAMIGLGGFAGPGGQQIPPNIEMAKHHIDLLDVLEAKTKGNLTPEEQQVLNVTLHQIRMAYVETVQGGAMPARPRSQPPR